MSDFRHGHPNPLINGVIDLLAHRDLEQAGKVTNPDSWLREARRRRWTRHQNQLTPQGLADLLDRPGARGNDPLEAARRDYDHEFKRSTCPACDDDNGLVCVDDTTDSWAVCQHERTMAWPR